MENNSHKDHRQRLRNRFRKEGFDFDHYEEHNILEFILCYSIPRIDTNELAHQLIRRFGSLAAVLDASYEELMKVEGVGENTAVFLKTFTPLFRAYEQSRRKKAVYLNSAAKAKQYFVPLFVGRTEEFVLVVCLDSERRVKGCEMVNRGTVSASAVNIRKIAEFAVRCNASSIILAHNHPDGPDEASAEDIMTTDSVYEAMKLIGIELSDHIIVSKGTPISLAEMGIIKRWL